MITVGGPGDRAGFEYVVDDAGVHHAVLRYAPAEPWAGVTEPVLTPWRWDGEPSRLACMEGERAGVARRLPDEEHGYEWGADLAPCDACGRDLVTEIAPGWYRHPECDATVDLT